MSLFCFVVWCFFLFFFLAWHWYQEASLSYDLNVVFFCVFCVLPGHISTGTHRSFLSGHIGFSYGDTSERGHLCLSCWDTSLFEHMSFLPRHISTGTHQCEDTSVWGHIGLFQRDTSPGGHINAGTNRGGDHIGLTQVKVYCLTACINCLCIFVISSCLTRTSS